MNSHSYGKHLFLCALMTILAACGTKRTADISDSTQPVQHDKIGSGNISDSRNAAMSGNLFCSFSGECEQSLAMVSVVTDDGIERCTGFLISDHEVMTNDHCIEKSISLKGWESRRKNIPCQDYVYTHFVGSDPEGAGLTVGCDSIEIRSGETGIASQDYAIIKLSSRVTDRAPVKLSPRGFKDAEKATIYRVQMTSDGTQTGFSGMQTKLECQASYASYLFPSIVEPSGQLMTFGDCAIQAGNSGSPIFNSDGAVSAIVQGYLTPKQDPEIAEQLQANLLDPSYGLLAIGTQIHCMHDVTGVNTRGCDSSINVIPLLPNEYLRNYVSFSVASLPTIPETEQWQEILPSETLAKTFVATPVCSLDPQFNGVVMTYKKGINRFMQAEWRAQSEMNEHLSAFVGHAGSEAFVSPTLGTLWVPACEQTSVSLVSRH
jgi:V8-like Glu-specific endopeptidase